MRQIYLFSIYQDKLGQFIVSEWIETSSSFFNATSSTTSDFTNHDFPSKYFEGKKHKEKKKICNLLRHSTEHITITRNLTDRERRYFSDKLISVTELTLANSNKRFLLKFTNKFIAFESYNHLKTLQVNPRFLYPQD